jgi:ribonucleoside-diphosphate reductase alpha chain
MKGFDAFAGVIKSGGKTRRAAKMVILNVDHPDIVEFIDCKMKEEHKAHVLIEQGYDPAIDGEAYSSVFFQNANHSVRVTDEFMQAVEDDRDWWTRNVNDGNAGGKIQRTRIAAPHGRIRLAMRRSRHAVRHHGEPLAHLQEHGAHQCFESVLGIHVPGRHGLQPGVAQPDEVSELERHVRRRSIPPCRGYHHHGAGNSGGQRQLPDSEIADNSHKFRPLGLGYANLGALLMSMALPYDSDRGRDVAGAVTALMCGEAYAQSGAHRRTPGSVRGLRREPRADARRHSHASRFDCAQSSRKTCSPRC